MRRIRDRAAFDLVGGGERDGSPVRRLSEDYASSAREYARRWGPAILPLALPLLEALPLGGARRVLDVGTGTGDLLPHLGARASEATVFAADRSDGMLRLAARHGAPVALMGAGALACRAGTMDVVTLVFMLFHLPRPFHALAEARRVLRGGGSVGVVTWSEEDAGLPGAEIWDEELERWGAGSEPRDASVRRHDLVDRPEKVEGLLREAGFRSARAWIGRFERRWDARTLLELQERCGSASRRLATLDAGDRAACVSAVRRRAGALSSEQLVWRPVVVYATATA